MRSEASKCVSLVKAMGEGLLLGAALISNVLGPVTRCDPKTRKKPGKGDTQEICFRVYAADSN
jgi:hypothetical protein